ncbi:histidine triad (HIT) protein [Ammonifex degensii KC4]|uniref:Histidine triad (HIT) protein n=1 Tax=Ammonifex degensii (strain DSM 10501 / KC4) TaxID=429009 RepID=C9RAT2_AMMDK|nr:HIT domain-containing protein [Ammonifex degensii]ACX51359.1 histidine triad (HIT) protein [Ammonifex degensii KC4]
MERLWAPWRAVYVSKSAGQPECIFCAKLQDNRDEENLLLLRREHAFVLMNLYPYNNGHLLVAPNRHVGDVTELTPEEWLEIFTLTKDMVEILRRVMRPDGFNIGINLGKVAGAGIPEHFHVHIVPRWEGDTSFMTVFGEVRVIPEALSDTYAKLKKALEEVGLA